MVYALENDDTESAANVAVAKEFLTEDELMAFFAADASGTPSSSVTGNNRGLPFSVCVSVCLSVCLCARECMSVCMLLLLLFLLLLFVLLFFSLCFFSFFSPPPPP